MSMSSLLAPGGCVVNTWRLPVMPLCVLLVCSGSILGNWVASSRLMGCGQRAEHGQRAAASKRLGHGDTRGCMVPGVRGQQLLDVRPSWKAPFRHSLKPPPSSLWLMWLTPPPHTPSPSTPLPAHAFIA